MSKPMSMSNIVANLFNWFKSVEKPSIELPNEEQEPEFNERGKPVYVPINHLTSILPSASFSIMYNTVEHAPAYSQTIEFFISACMESFTIKGRHSSERNIQKQDHLVNLVSITGLPFKTQLFLATFLAAKLGSYGYDSTVLLTRKRKPRDGYFYSLKENTLRIYAIKSDMRNLNSNPAIHSHLCGIIETDRTYVLQSSGSFKPFGKLAIVNRWRNAGDTQHTFNDCNKAIANMMRKKKQLEKEINYD